MKSMKKVIATLAATMILTTSVVSVASAGGIKDFFSGVGGTIAHGLKTAYHAVVDTGEYVFTSKRGEECYAETCESASKVKDNAIDAYDGVVKTAEDVYSFGKGTVQTVSGAVATAGAAAIEGVSNLVTGNDDYSWTNATIGLMKDGYDNMDAGFDTMVEAASLINPAVAIAANGVKIVKAAGEAAVGYKDRDWDNVGKTVVDSGMNIATAAVGGMAASSVSSASGVVAENIAAKAVAAGAGTAAKATMQIANDLKNDNERDALDIVMEDLFTSAATGAAAFGTGLVVNK